MKSLFNVIIIICIHWGLYAQPPPYFTFKKDRIECTGAILDENEFLVFSGELTLEESTMATPIIGEFLKYNKIQYFKPIIPFAYEKKYSLLYKGVISYFKIETPKDYKFLRVHTIYPTSTELPANILKFHIQFSRPINPTNVYEHIYFINSNGIKVDRAILTLENALISEDGTLLTLWIEPGRQKRGLAPNVALGQVFTPGENYFLIVSEHLKDRNGINNMQQQFSRQFQIVESDRTKPVLDSWEIAPPIVDTTSDLVISSDGALDFIGATHKINLYDSQRNQINGEWKLANGDRQLIFKPNEKWTKGTFWLLVDDKLDDLAGNNLLRLFDSEINASTEGQQTSLKKFKLSFTIE